MEKSDFSEHQRLTVTWRDEGGKLRPANIYIFKMYDEFMIARMTDKDGLLRKIPYGDILKVVKEHAVSEEDRFFIPDAVLNEKVWKDRSTMMRYSSSPHMGK